MTEAELQAWFEVAKIALPEFLRRGDGPKAAATCAAYTADEFIVQARRRVAPTD